MQKAPRGKTRGGGGMEVRPPAQDRLSGIADVPPRMLSPRNQLIRVILYNRTRLDCPFFGSPIPTLRW